MFRICWTGRCTLDSIDTSRARRNSIRLMLVSGGSSVSSAVAKSPDMTAPERFHVFADLLRQAPLRRLRYPSGLEHLGTVRDAILTDLADLEPPPTEPRLRRRGP